MDKKIITTSVRLKDYALWYYFRFFPSNRKLEQKLLEKTELNRELVDSIIDNIKHLFTEDDIIRSNIKNLIFRNKNLNYIRLNLMKKQFPKERINEILANEFWSEEKSILDPFSLMKKIENYKNKGKSIQYIKNQLIERKLDRESVDNALLEVYWVDWDNENLIREYNKLEWKYDKQKIIEKLLRKWFFYGEIKNILK